MSIVGVRFRRAREVAYFEANGLDLIVDDAVVVQTAEGPRLAWVVISPDQVIYSEVEEPLQPILRKASEEDMKSSRGLGLPPRG